MEEGGWGGGVALHATKFRKQVKRHLSLTLTI